MGLQSRLAVLDGAWSKCDLARVGEAETGVAGRAFGEHDGQDAGPLIEVVVDFGRGLVLMRAQDPAYLLSQAALIGDPRGEKPAHAEVPSAAEPRTEVTPAAAHKPTCLPG